MAACADVPAGGIRAYLDGETAALTCDQLQRLGSVLGIDYRILLPPAHGCDADGEVVCTLDQSRSTIRSFKSYTVASAAMASHVPDVCGLFIVIDKTKPAGLDLEDFASTHYLVTRGAPTIRMRRSSGPIAERALEPMDSVWLAPLTPHEWIGAGAVLKLSGGACCSYLGKRSRSTRLSSPTIQASTTI